MNFEFFNNSASLITIGVMVGGGLLVFILRKFVFKRKKRSGTSAIISKPPVIEATSTHTPVPAPLVAGFLCKCGALLPTEKERNQHVAEWAVRERGIHGKVKVPKPFKAINPKESEVKGVPGLIVGDDQPIRALIWRYPHDGEITVEFSKINKPCGNLFYSDASMPESGQTYCIKENKDGSFSPYDPRHDNLVSTKTPQMAFYATHWDRADGVWIYEIPIWQTIAKFFVYTVMGVALFIVILQLGG